VTHPPFCDKGKASTSNARRTSTLFLTIYMISSAVWWYLVVLVHVSRNFWSLFCYNSVLDVYFTSCSVQYSYYKVYVTITYQVKLTSWTDRLHDLRKLSLASVEINWK
jgi:hypothetical protein